MRDVSAQTSATRLEWLHAGQELLREGGRQAVKLSALSRRVGRTTGSFYHHFANMSEYLTALIHYFGEEQPVASLEAISALDPRARLVRMGAITVMDNMVPLYTAMREWGTYDLEAAEAVAAADGALLTFLERAFRDLGCSESEARVRAELLFAIGAMPLAPPWPRSSGLIKQVLDILAPESE